MLKNSINQFNYLFYFTYGIFIINTTLIKNINLSVYKIIFLLVMSLFSINIIFKKYNLRQFIYIILTILFSLVIASLSDDSDLLIVIIMILSAVGFDFIKTVKIDFYCRIFGVIFTIIFSFIGLTQDFIMYRINETGHSEIRHSLGFIHPNTLNSNIFILIISYIYLRNKKLTFLDYGLSVLIIYIVSLITGSRSGILGISIFLVLLFLNKIFIIFNNKYVRRIILIIVPICTIISILTAYLYKYNFQFINTLNTLLTGRIKSASFFINNYGPSFLGQKIKLVSVIESQSTSMYQMILDNLYVSIIVRNGILFTFFYNYFYVRLMKLYLQNKNYLICILIITLSLYGFVEKIAITPETCLITLLLSNILMSHHQKWCLD